MVVVEKKRHIEVSLLSKAKTKNKKKKLQKLYRDLKFYENATYTNSCLDVWKTQDKIKKFKV